MNKSGLICKILLFSFDYPPNTGGISRLCAHIAAGLNKHCPVRILTQKWSGEEFSDIPELPTVRVFYKRRFRGITLFVALCKLIFNFRDCNLILCGEWYTEGLIALLSNIVRRRRIIILAHGNELITRVKIKSWLKRIVFSRADLVIANSNYTLQLVKKTMGTSPSSVITLAVDVNFFYPQKTSPGLMEKLELQGKKVLLSVSSLKDYKGHDTVLKALSELPEKKQYAYLIIGDGLNRKTISDMAKLLGLENQVKLLGFIPEGELRKYYNLCDIFILCTREDLNNGTVEGFGLVFLEAQACGKPAIGTRAGGIPEAILENETGWLITQDDYFELRNLLTGLFGNPDKIKEAGYRARQWVEQECTWEKYINKLWRHIHNLNPE